MKHLLLTTIAAVVLVGCGESQQSAPAPEAKPVEPVAEASQPEPPTAEAPAISIHHAAGRGNIKTIKQHLDAGIDVNAKETGLFDWSVLHRATDSGHYEIVQLLIKKGANVNITGPSGTPLHQVLLYGKKNQIIIAELLISNGADVNAKNEKGTAPLHLAAGRGYKETAELLIAKGADVNTKNNTDRTPLHWAAQHDQKEIVELFIAEGADVNAKTQEGFSPLHRSASFGHAEVSKLLIAKGADVNVYNTNGWTPLHSAAYSGEAEVSELLIAKGAKVNVMDILGKTPLDAQRRQKLDITDLLRKHGGKTGEELKAEGK